ncbi:MAG: MFS transporter [Raoultibacter sp.]
MKAKKYLFALVTCYMCYFTHGIQAIILSQNKVDFFTQWGYTDPAAGAAAVSLAITATGFGKLLTVWIGGEVSDRFGRKKMAVIGGILYILFFAGLLFTNNFYVACACSFLAGVATSGFWDAAFYPAAQEAAPKYSSSAIIGIKLVISIAGIIYPLLAVATSQAGSWQINIWIPLIFSIIVTIMAIFTPFIYDDELKAKAKNAGTEAGAKIKNAAQEAIEAEKAKLKSKPNRLVNFFTMFYGFVCMFIMYGAQQYTKAFGMNNCGLDAMSAAGLTSIYTAGSIIAVIFWAFMMGKLRWDPLKVVLIDSIFTAVALIVVLLVQQVVVVYAAIAILGFFAAGGALQTGIAVRQELCPGPKGRNVGIYYTWMGAASCFLPYIVSAMTGVVGETQAVYTMMALLLVASIIAIFMMVYLVAQSKKIFGESALTRKVD